MVFESDMSKMLEPYLLKNYDAYYPEVPLFSKRIDYVCIDKRKDKIVAIEVKVRNWKKALRQAINYRICAHKVYVALWREYIHCIDKKRFEDFGIGILEVDGSVMVTQESKELNLTQETPMEMIKSYIKNLNLGGIKDG